MDFDLSTDQRALRDAARDLLAGLSGSAAVRAAGASGDGLDRRLWKEMCQQGWPAVALPEAQGGLGLGDVELAVLAEQVGRHVSPAPFLSTALAVRALAAEPAAGHLLQRVALGGAIGAVAWGSGPVIDAPVADVVVVVGDDAVTAHAPTDRPAAEPAMDLTRTLGWFRPVDDGIVLGGADLAADLLDAGAVGYAAELLGLAERMLEVSVEYAKVREQFGQPIGAFQAVKHRCADMLVDVEGIRSAVWYAAWALSVRADDASLAASAAKAWASDAGRRVLSSALQVHGGIGFTWEHDLHLYLKRAQLDAVNFGTAAFHRERLARLLKERLAAGQPVF